MLAAVPTRTSRAAHVAVGAFVLVVVAWGMFAMRQAGLWGDGPDLLTRYTESKTSNWHHPLVLPSVRLLAWLTGASAFDAFGMLSALGIGLLSAGVYWVATLWGARRGVALVLALVAATTPGAWFQGTTIEVHAFHAGVVSILVAPGLIALGGSSSRRLFLTFLAMGFLTTATHLAAPILFPGWCVAAFVRSSGHGAAATGRWRKSFAVALSLSLGAMAAYLWARSNGAFSGSEGGIQQVTLGMAHPTGFLRSLGRELPFALGALLVTGIYAGCFRQESAFPFAPILIWVGVPIVFFGALDIPTYGGYFLPLVPFVCMAALRLVALAPAKIGPPLLALGLVAQVGFLASWQGGDLAIQRAARSEARLAAATRLLPDGGVLVCADGSLQTVNGRLPGIFEINLWRQLRDARARNDSSETFMATVRAPLVDMLARYPGRLVIEREWARPGVDLEQAERYLEALETLIRATCVVEQLNSQASPGVPDWRLIGPLP